MAGWYERTLRWQLACVLLSMAAHAVPAAATDYHVCECDAGSMAGCVPGDDAAPGTRAQPWRSYERARLAFANLAAGDGLFFCAGGAWTLDARSGDRWVNRQCRATQPCYVQQYFPDGVAADAPPPLITRTNGDDGFDFADGGLAESESGYVISGLRLVGSGSGFGIFLYNDIDAVRLEHLDISGFAIGVHLAGSQGCNPVDPQCDGRNSGIQLRHSYIHDNRSQGWLGGSSFTVIESNLFERNGSRAILDHNIYLSGDTDGLRIFGNTLFGSALDAQGACQGASLVVHGEHRNLQIESNRIFELPGAAGPGCWGIAVDPGYPGTPEGFVDLVIRGNEVWNVGNVGIGVSACQDCLIENNIVVQQQPIYTRAIAAPDLAARSEDLADARITVRNNSILFGSSASGIGIDLRTATPADRARIVSNAIHYSGTDSGFNCLTLAPPFDAYPRIDHNLCVAPAAPGAEWVNGEGAGAAGLQAWQSTSGHDQHSAWRAPGFSILDPVDGLGLRLIPGSAGIDAGAPLDSSPLDFLFQARVGIPDVGAWEYASATVPQFFANGFEAP